MSTILKTLKKLEEEKSVLEQGVDLKRLVLQGEQPPSPSSRGEIRKIGMMAGVLLGGALLGGAMFYFLHRAPPEKPLLPAVSKPAPAAADSSTNGDQMLLSGIPLSHIAGPRGEETRAREKPDIIEEKIEEPAREVRVKPPEPKVPDLPEELEGIGSLLVPGRRSPSTPSPASVQPQSTVRSGHITGMKVKGIIFFGDGSPSNHIFISTPDRNNLKMKVGDTVLGASLLSVQSDKAIFSFHNKQIQIGIGE